MKEFKPVHYGGWTIRTKRTYPDQYYIYKIELGGEQISEWISVQRGNNKEKTVDIAKRAIDTFYKNKVIISEHGAVLHERYDQFRGTHFG